uniref:HupF/HypC family protein n=1 Tax=Candidatus Kentrum sp. FW TaxID=2126338 RepID=A0A450TEL0_9GAMM|nr:MAG: HupF/HypC family protein [Candidatus Kentron sp. FW]
MCLSIPMQVETIEKHTARCVAGGVHRDVSLFVHVSEK